MDEELLEASAFLAIGDLEAEGLPELATGALLRGVDSPSLRMLAGIDPRDVRDARDAFICALAELGIPAPSAEEARWLLTYRRLEGVAAGRLSPAQVASWIWSVVRHEVELEGDLRIFV